MSQSRPVSPGGTSSGMPSTPTKLRPAPKSGCGSLRASLASEHNHGCPPSPRHIIRRSNALSQMESRRAHTDTYGQRDCLDLRICRTSSVRGYLTALFPPALPFALSLACGAMEYHAVLACQDSGAQAWILTAATVTACGPLLAGIAIACRFYSFYRIEDWVAHRFLSLCARMFQKVVIAPLCGPRPTAPALSKTRRPWPASMLLKSVPYGAALGVTTVGMCMGSWPAVRGCGAMVVRSSNQGPIVMAFGSSKDVQCACLQVALAFSKRAHQASMALDTPKTHFKCPTHAAY